MKLLLILAALVLALPAGAIERIRVQAAQVHAEGVTLDGVVIDARLQAAARMAITLEAARATLPPDQSELAGAISALRVRCASAALGEPRLVCPALELQATSSRWGRQTFDGRVTFDPGAGVLDADGGSMAPGNIPVKLVLAADPSGFEVRASAAAVDAVKIAEQLRPRVQLPDGLTLQGKADVDLHLLARGDAMQLDLRARFTEAGFQNKDYTWIGEKLAFAVEAQADLGNTPWVFELRANSAAGQSLTGPVLLDFNQHPLQLQLGGRLDDSELAITRLAANLPGLLRASGSARIRLTPFTVLDAELEAPELHFPAAYTAFLQLPLATTPFNQLKVQGRAAAALAVRDNAPTRLDLIVQELAFSDTSRSLEVTGVSAELHWRDDITDPRVSYLAWESSRGWGIVGARTRLDFTTGGRDIQLLKPARLPFFDGALLVNTLAVENIGTAQLSGVFDAQIEPISVAPIARALGWPEFQGQLSGRIPGLTYREGVLGVQGNIEADVFGGKVVARDLRVREPLGPWPRLFGNITARNLDLDLITRTFEFGSITGRLDADLLNLETFNWSPVAFDLKLATPPGDRSRHRISQRAVQNLSDIGGGGGGVAAALQSGALRFFDEFPYDRLGVSCRLRNDVCQMDGVGRSGAGFYLLKGKGLPRIDIIGNNRRVDWPLLVQQVRDALANPGNIDVN
jgi:hypothetical protein